MDMIYPAQHAKIYIPRDFNNRRQKTVFEAAHRVPGESIHWHLNETYLGSTSDIHQIEVDTEEGSYTLTLVDGKGERLVRRFIVLKKLNSWYTQQILHEMLRVRPCPRCPYRKWLGVKRAYSKRLVGGSKCSA